MLCKRNPIRLSYRKKDDACAWEVHYMFCDSYGLFPVYRKKKIRKVFIGKNKKKKTEELCRLPLV